MKSLIVAALGLSTCYADAASQSNWSGGPGTPGPVSAWGDCFSLDSGTDWSISGQVGILPQFACIEHLVDGAANDAICICSGDIDGDGDQDILGAASFSGEIVWWENTDGTGTVWAKHLIDGQFLNALGVSLADIDGDGDEDVLGAAGFPNDITWWENEDGSGTIWTKRTIDGDYFGAHSVGSDDIDGDGDQDVLGAAVYASDITWWENENGSGTVWTKRTIDGDYFGAYDVTSDDIDGDGDRDVLGAAYGADEIAWWENEDGVGTSWVKHTVSGLFDGASCVASGDLDGDGDTDILGTAYIAGTVAWWENIDGAGTVWEGHSIAMAFAGAGGLDVDDLDGDGDLDVMASAYDADRISWWENTNGTGTVWIEHSIDEAFDGASSVESCDLDGDGDRDVLGTAYDGEAVAWWELTSYASSAMLESSVLYCGCDPDWGTLLWSASTPSGTGVAFQVRASDDYSQMGTWSDTLMAPCTLHGVLADNLSYIQYRAILGTSDPSVTPTLLDMTVTWNPLGAEEDPSPGFILCPVVPNPSPGALTVTFGLPEPESVSLVFFDVTGRLVLETAPSEYGQGTHLLQPGTLRPGIYFVRMTAGEFTATQRFVVVE
jgi:hypothetical protein